MPFDLISTFVAWCPPQMVVPALLTGLAGYAIAGRTTRSNERIAVLTKPDHVIDKSDARGALSTDALTRRFQALMDGYETHIQNLTEEIQSLRTEVRELKTQLSDYEARNAPAG